MKLIIDIPEETYDYWKEHKHEYVLSEAIANGTPYNPTGECISKSEVEKLGATCLARRNEDGQLEAIISLDLAPTIEDEIKWHNLKENPDDKPTKLGWYCCKISSSDDLKMVFGQSEVMSGMYDAWLPVSCPY